MLGRQEGVIRIESICYLIDKKTESFHLYIQSGSTPTGTEGRKQDSHREKRRLADHPSVTSMKPRSGSSGVWTCMTSPDPEVCTLRTGTGGLSYKNGCRSFFSFSHSFCYHPCISSGAYRLSFSTLFVPPFFPCWLHFFLFPRISPYFFVLPTGRYLLLPLKLYNGTLLYRKRQIPGSRPG